MVRRQRELEENLGKKPDCSFSRKDKAMQGMASLNNFSRWNSSSQIVS